VTGGPDDPAALLAFDRDHVWHPYAPIPATTTPLVVRGAEGVRLHVTTPDGDELELVDAMSSWWSAIHGYRHPALVAAVTAQAQELSHVMFGGLTHRPAVELARRLVELTPAPLDAVFFADSGSVAVEVALKMALQHWRSLGRPAKRRLLTWRGGYHGDTLFAMSVCDPEGGMHALWTDVVPAQVFVGVPPAGFDAPLDDAFVAELRAAVAAHADELAAVVDQFERLTFDVITAHGGRVVKMIGDEVMFSVDSPRAAAEIALALVEGGRRDDQVSDLRVGLAYGPLIEREGDLYGPVVNLASRITAIAFPGTVLVDAGLREQLAGDARYVLRTMRPRYLKDIGRVGLWVLRRGGPPEDRFAARRQALREAVSARVEPGRHR